jgi:hypothetical protein
MQMDDEPEGIGKEDLPWTSSLFFPDIPYTRCEEAFCWV